MNSLPVSTYDTELKLKFYKDEFRGIDNEEKNIISNTEFKWVQTTQIP